MQYEFYFLQVRKVLNMRIPDRSIHAVLFGLLQARNIYNMCSPQSALQTCIKNMLKLCALILTVFLNLTLPEMFSMTKLTVTMLKKKHPLENIGVWFFIFIINLFSTPDFFHSHVTSLTAGIKVSTFKILVGPVVNISKILYSYYKGFSLQMHYCNNTCVPVWGMFFCNS